MLQKNKMLSLAAACTLLCMGVTEAAVTAIFTQVGATVQVTWTGSYDVPTPNDSFVGYQGAVGYSVVGLGVQTAISGAGGSETTNPVVNGGEIFPLGGSGELTGDYSGTTFGFALNGEDLKTEGCLILPKDYAGSSILTPVGTMTFADITLAGIFGSSLPTNRLIYRGTGSVEGSRDIYITAVPEPSSTLMLGLFATAALFTRKRAVR